LFIKKSGSDETGDEDNSDDEDLDVDYETTSNKEAGKEPLLEGEDEEDEEI